MQLKRYRKSRFYSITNWSLSQGIHRWKTSHKHSKPAFTTNYTGQADGSTSSITFYSVYEITHAHFSCWQQKINALMNGVNSFMPSAVICYLDHCCVWIVEQFWTCVNNGNFKGFRFVVVWEQELPQFGKGEKRKRVWIWHVEQRFTWTIFPSLLDTKCSSLNITRCPFEDLLKSGILKAYWIQRVLSRVLKLDPYL